MKVASVILCAVLSLTLGAPQLPPRLNIPGAIPLPPSRPAPFRQQRIHGDSPPLRLRRPNPVPAPAPVRPVIEEPEEPVPTPINNSFDDEVTKLGISALQSAVRQAGAPEEESTRPVQFRPERPVPVLRQDIREGPPPSARAENYPRPLPVQRENIPRPLLRQEQREEPPVRQQHRHSQQRQQIPIQPSPQPVRQPARSHPVRQPSQHLDEEGHSRPNRNRKPTSQILRKYRTDNPDGSISWGFENDDGTFKEETLGVDCVIKGKYGYVDPDGVRREYTYETGNKCDEPEQEEELLPERPQLQVQPRKQQPYRP